MRLRECGECGADMVTDHLECEYCGADDLGQCCIAVPNHDCWRAGDCDAPPQEAA